MVVKRILAVIATTLLALSLLPASAYAAQAQVPFSVSIAGCPGAITEGTLEWVTEQTVKVEGYVGTYKPFPSCTPSEISGFHLITFRGHNGADTVAGKNFIAGEPAKDIAFELVASPEVPIERVTVHPCYFMLRPITMLQCVPPTEYRPAA